MEIIEEVPRRVVFIILLVSIIILAAWPVFAANRVLSLDGDRDYVEMADSEALNDIGSQVTMETWIKPKEYTSLWMPIIYKGDKRVSDEWRNRSYLLQLHSSGFIQLASAPEGQAQIFLNSPGELITLNNWYHVAGVIDSRKGRMRIFINGVEMAGRDPGRDSGRDIHISALPLRIGWTHEEDIAYHASFAGEMDEVRIWNRARTQEEIQQTMYKTLSGREPGLVGYWRFDDTGETVTDSSPGGTHGKLMGDAHMVESELPGPEEMVIPTFISGIITDESGKPIPDATVRLEKDKKSIAQSQSDASGNYLVAVVIPKSESGLYDIFAGKGILGIWHKGVALAPGEEKTLNLTLGENVSVRGNLLMPDDKTPHVAVPVEIMHNGKVMDTILSDEDGKYRFINLKPGSYKLRCQVLGGYVYYGKDGISSDESQATYLQVRSGRTLRATDLRFPAFRKGTWRNYTVRDGLPGDNINTLYRDPDGVLWVGTFGSGVFRYDGREMVNFTTEDGLANNIVSSICRGPDGDMWFGTGIWYILGNGVSRYDGKEFRTYTMQDGLAGNTINAIYCDPDGILWFSSGCWREEAGGISQYDGKEFRSFTEEDYAKASQSPPGVVTAIHRAPDGTVWFGRLGGLYQYDGARFQTLSLPGLGWVFAINSGPDGTLWFGTWRDGVYRYDGKRLVNFTPRDGLADDTVSAIHHDPDGIMWFGTDKGVSAYDGKTFVNYTVHDGLADVGVRAIHQDQDGVLWFGTGGGLSRYDERTFTNITTRDGLANNDVRAIHRDSHGVLWFGTKSGFSRYADGELTDFPGSDELANKVITSIESDASGSIWFGTRWSGAFRYDGKELRSLLGGQILSVHRAPDGIMWFGTMYGVRSYDGKEFRTLTGEDNLKMASRIHSTPDGTLWFGTMNNGIYRYDGQTFTNFTTADGLLSNSIEAIYCDPNGLVWFGAGGVARYDGETIKIFTSGDGLANNRVWAIHRDPDGVMWFGTRWGVSAYDGSAWTSLDMDDGLAGDSVSSIYQDADGVLWFGTEGGVTQYRRDTNPPVARIISVKVEGESYPATGAIPPLVVGNHVSIEYSSIDFKTIPRKRQYRYRIKELDSDWRSITRAEEFEWTPDKPGTYTFEVQAIDRDLNYSDPVSITIPVSAMPFYKTNTFLISLSIMSLVMFLAATTFGIQRWRSSQAEKLRLRQELDDARQMQMRLIPDKAPTLEGFDIAGFCQPAREVGGDFFDYLSLSDGKMGIALADISGKGLKAAMNAVLTNGMLREVTKMETTSGGILSLLNTDLYPMMEKHMFAAIELAILEQNSHMLHWANAAQPYPLIKRNGQVFEFKSDGSLPLCMMPEASYSDLDMEIHAGDIIVFYTDGIMEAENPSEEMYGTERLHEFMTNLDSRMSSEEIIKAIIDDVKAFIDKAEQYDDMTVIVVRKL